MLVIVRVLQYYNMYDAIMEVQATTRHNLSLTTWWYARVAPHHNSIKCKVSLNSGSVMWCQQETMAACQDVTGHGDFTIWPLYL